MDSSQLLSELQPPQSLPGAFASTMQSYRALNPSTSHRGTRRAVTSIASSSVGGDVSAVFHFSSSSAMRLSAYLTEDGANGSSDPSNGPTTRSRKRKHSETDQNPPDSETSSSASSVSQAPAAVRASRKISSSKRGRKAQLKKPPPGSCAPGVAAAAAAKVSSDDDEDDVGEKKPEAVHTCCICMSDVEPLDLAHINGCEHRFCFVCIEKWAARENSCPLCKQRFTKIDRVNKKKKKGSKNTKKVKQRDQRTDLVSGIAIEGLIASIRGNSGLPSFFFSPGVGRVPFGASAATSARAYASRSAAASAPARANHEMDSDDDDDYPLPFLRALHGGHFVSPSLSVALGRYSTALATNPGRSYASNMNDSTAGNGAENPLEIDDDSDEEVEVVQVTRP